MNKVILVGRLTRDPEVRYSNNGTAVARYSLAVDRKYKGQNGERETDFINCVAFGKVSEFAEKYLSKGQKVLVVGRIQTSKYTNNEGKTIYNTDIVVEEHEFMEAKRGDNKAGRDEFSEEEYSFMAIPDGADDEGLPFA